MQHAKVGVNKNYNKYKLITSHYSTQNITGETKLKSLYAYLTSWNIFDVEERRILLISKSLADTGDFGVQIHIYITSRHKWITLMSCPLVVLTRLRFEHKQATEMSAVANTRTAMVMMRIQIQP